MALNERAVCLQGDLVVTNKKLYMTVRLMPNLMTLHDREPTQRLFFAIFATLPTFAAHHVEHNGDRHT